MKKIINFIEEKTDCRCYKTVKFCFDKFDFPLNEYDDHLNITVRRSGESVKHKSSINLNTLARDLRETTVPLFNFFLDGSRRTYKIDDIAIDNRMYPIVAGQIGVGCCQRIEQGSFKTAFFNNELVISLPDCIDKDGQNDLYYNNLLQKLNEVEILKKYDLKFAKILPYDYSKLKDNEKYENRAIAKIQDEMIEQEKKAVEYLVKENYLSHDAYLLKDGSLEYSEKGLYEKSYKLSNIKVNYRYVIGVSKSFNPEKCVDENNKSNAVKIANLPLFHRTPAYLYEPDIIHGVKFSIWYLRIRDAKRTLNPFDGVVKIEKILITDEEQEYGLDAHLIDMISANIINERNPVAYGSDVRWANHLYPVYITEKFIKSQYINDHYYLNLF